MFEGEFEDMCANKLLLVSIGGLAECRLWAYTGARTPISAGDDNILSMFVNVWTIGPADFLFHSSIVNEVDTQHLDINAYYRNVYIFYDKLKIKKISNLMALPLSDSKPIDRTSICLLIFISNWYPHVNFKLISNGCRYLFESSYTRMIYYGVKPLDFLDFSCKSSPRSDPINYWMHALRMI